VSRSCAVEVGEISVLQCYADRVRRCNGRVLERAARDAAKRALYEAKLIF